MPVSTQEVERIARAFHDAYEAQARLAGWATQQASRVDFDELPAENRTTMLNTVAFLLDTGVIRGAPERPDAR